MKDPLPHLAAESTSQYVNGELRDFDEVKAISQINRQTLKMVAGEQGRKDVMAEKENI